ncbi:MAG: restriction system-associated AAA family ATPase [Bacteroidetes bacterium]|nr:restriction system-associated AAA family ATPase [Bacteroidota bacterium]
MRLLNLKLLTKFRSLDAGVNFRFDKVELFDNKLEPICLVGLNGSGKSNLLEVVAEVFYYLEKYSESEGKNKKKHSTPFGFEITYQIDITYELARNSNLKNIETLDWEGSRETIVTIVKSANELPKITLESDGRVRVEESTDPAMFILPNHIIGYSSGQNELISNPFIKLKYEYFEQLEKKQQADYNLELGLTRLFFLDYETSHLITLINCLFSEENEVSVITNALKLDKEDPLDSFEVIIRYTNYKNNRIKIARALEVAIEKLKECATTYEETGNELKLDYFVNKETRLAFKRKFGSALILFRDFYYLNLLNIHQEPVSVRRKIKEAPSNTYDNLLHMIPTPPREDLNFCIDKMRLRKTNGVLIKYKNLSDGEHQLMHVLGSMILLNTSGSLLLYDEPETHFNPDWRSKLISLINKTVIEKVQSDKIRKQEILITSHSPFIVSDCRPERVFIFKNGKTSTPKINTFGAAVSLITMKVFGKSETISELANQKLDKIVQSYKKGTVDLQSAILKANSLGDSVEKLLTIDQLKKIKPLKQKK